MKVFGELYRARELLWVLVLRDLRGRTRASVLGPLWIVVQPLAATGLFTFLLQTVLRLQPSGDIPYPVFVFAGMVVWNYFNMTLTASTESLVQHSDLLRQVNIPREVLILYHLIAKSIDFVLALVVLVVLCLIYGVTLKPTLILAPVLLLPVMVLSQGLGLILAPLNVAVRDVGKALPLLLTFGIYLTPVLYPLEGVPERWRTLYLLNPLAGLVESFRSLALRGEGPDWTVLAGASLGALVVFAVGQWLFDQFETVLADLV